MQSSRHLRSSLSSLARNAGQRPSYSLECLHNYRRICYSAARRAEKQPLTAATANTQDVEAKTTSAVDNVYAPPPDPTVRAVPPHLVGPRAPPAPAADPEVKDAVDAAETIEELPMLQRPLGVHDRPVAERQTWSKMAEEMLDEEKRLEKRKHLIKAATKGYYTDLLATRKFAGKTWIAPKVMIRADKALYFPNMYGTALTGAKVHTTDLCQGKVSIIAVLCTRMSEIQTANFVKEAHELHQNNPMYQFIQINLQENLLRSLLVSLFTSGIKKSVPESLWPTYLVSNQNMDYIRDDLGMTNRHIGYVYLVDEQCRVRWAGCADPRPEESAALSVCASVLLKRHETPKKA